MALLEDDDPAPVVARDDGPRIRVWTHRNGMSTIELDLTDAEARRVLPALQGYLRDLCVVPARLQ